MLAEDDENGDEDEYNIHKKMISLGRGVSLTVHYPVSRCQGTIQITSDTKLTSHRIKSWCLQQSWHPKIKMHFQHCNDTILSVC